MVKHVKNGQIKIEIKFNFFYKLTIKIKINLFESLMIKIKLHFDYILIEMKLNFENKKITIRLIND